jgi:hypothetical protein
MSPHQRRLRGTMQTHITIAIAIAMMSLFALMFWQTVIDATENDAAVASTQLKPQYVVSPDPYLPNKRLRPVW